FAYYKLGQSIGVEENNNGLIPAEYSLGQNYPNPFNPATKISYALPEGGRVKLNIYDSLGRLVTTLVDEERAAGRYEVMFNASNLSSGIYFYEVVTKNFRSAKKMCLLK
ncbi:MAG TPA: T9SS type A sorting domain-containing protein, partial [Ignavibacteriales bacterium]|nr:T9SS type A sorting domain-containing protein [Ignavibacteriales bacterium]